MISQDQQTIETLSNLGAQVMLYQVLQVLKHQGFVKEGVKYQLAVDWDTLSTGKLVAFLGEDGTGEHQSFELNSQQLLDSLTPKF